MSTDFVSRRSILESLERRQLLAQLVIDGTSAADVITLSLDGANVVVDLNGTISTHADTGVTSILINGLEGADTINIESNGANQTTINGGDGLDVVKLSPTANNLNSVVGSVNLLAGADGATLSLFDGSSALNSAYTINSTSIARSGFGGVTFDSALSNLELRATSGNNIFNVHSTPLAPTSIFGLEGNDSCRITPTSQNLDNLGGSFDFYGGNGTDELVFFDGNHAAGDNWSISSTEIARDAIELVTYESESVRIFQGTGDNETVVTDFSSSLLFIDCWEGNDIVRLNGIGAGSRVELVGYIGDDKFYVESSAPTSEIDIAGEVGANEVWIANESRDLSTVAGSVNFVGGGSGDTFGIFDDQHSNQTSYDIESDSIANDVTSGVFTFSNVTNVALHGSSGNNTYNFDSTALGTSTEIVLGSGDDEVRVTDRLGDVSVMQGEVVLQSSDGVDSLFVFDDRTNSNGNFVFTDTKLTGVAFAAMSYAVENVELYCPMGDNDVIVKNASSVK
ncbi:MAG TPA: hypothetical protein PK402_02130, partial [Tepidisphaeraceae bacterium]|nr:hypothetical protein [Tepidisphaeraceae bacterium]